VVESGPPEQLHNSSSEWVQQFLNGRADGPVPFQLSAPDYGADLAASVERLNA